MGAMRRHCSQKKRRNSSREKKAFPPIFALFCCPVAVVSHLPFDPKARFCGLRPTTLLSFPFPLCIMHFIPVVSAPQSPSSFSKSGVCVVNKTFIPAGGGHGGEYINAAACCPGDPSTLASCPIFPGAHAGPICICVHTAPEQPGSSFPQRVVIDVYNLALTHAPKEAAAPSPISLFPRLLPYRRCHLGLPPPPFLLSFSPPAIHFRPPHYRRYI